MIVSNLKSLTRYEKIIPYFNELFDFLIVNDLKSKENGIISIIEDKLYISVVEIKKKQKSVQILEAHRDYLDIHIPIIGQELIGWKTTEECSVEVQPYQKENDCILFSDRPYFYIKLEPGQFAVVFPEDAHAPAIGSGVLKKAIVKIRITS